MTQSPITQISREVAKHVEIRDALQGMYEDLDPQALADTLEGETDLNAALLSVCEAALEHEAMAVATQARIDALQARKHRLVSSAETLRAIALQAMDTSGVDKIQGATMTISRRQVAGKLVVTDEAQVPAQFWTPQPPKMDKKALLSAVKDGAIKGAELSNGGISLTIRVK